MSNRLRMPLPRTSCRAIEAVCPLRARRECSANRLRASIRCLAALHSQAFRPQAQSQEGEFPGWKRDHKTEESQDRPLTDSSQPGDTPTQVERSGITPKTMDPGTDPQAKRFVAKTGRRHIAGWGRGKKRVDGWIAGEDDGGRLIRGSYIRTATPPLSLCYHYRYGYDSDYDYHHYPSDTTSLFPPSASASASRSPLSSSTPSFFLWASSSSWLPRSVSLPLSDSPPSWAISVVHSLRLPGQL